MDYIKPTECLEALLTTGAAKSKLSIGNLLIRGFLAGALLAYATSLAITATLQTGLPIVGAFVFPVGFVMVVLLGLELLTGNFAILPITAIDRQTTLARLCANFGWVFIANLLGSVAYGGLIYYSAPATQLAEKLIAAAELKTLGYAAMGSDGLLACFTKAILCNWMVTLGVVLAAVSSSTIGKIIACALPIFMFFAHGFEHLVVNCFVIPTGMLLGAHVSGMDWLIWNLIPVALGNLVGGFLLTGLPIYLTHRRRSRIEQAISVSTAECPAAK